MPSAARTTTFLLTDIEGSTRLWEERREAMAVALEVHDSMLRAVVERAGGIVVKTTGDGLLAAFDRPESAVGAAWRVSARSTDTTGRRPARSGCGWRSTPHKTPAVRAWLARHPRVTFHFTPTSASWMNQIEIWFGILTRQAIRRGSFGSVKELVAKIDTFTRHWNSGATPFLWVKTADEILAKAVRKPRAIGESGH